MYKFLIVVYVSVVITTTLFAQDVKPSQKRLDFAKTYFEIGGTYSPSFTGKRLIDGQTVSFKNSPSINQYLTWGAFHFWGHAEFYVTFPLMQKTIHENAETNYLLQQYATTGARVYPWAMQENKIRPYIGVYWGATDFKQIIKAEDNQPVLSKDFLMNFETGLTYSYKSIGLRLGIHYFPDHTWEYPISKTQKEEIKTPAYNIQIGLLYAFDASKKSKGDTQQWDEFPRVSKPSYNARKFGDFFLGIGPSLSYSLVNSEYNMEQLPYLKEKLSSKNYFDIAVGYQFNRANFFTALSFRNPTFETAGYGSSQIIRKNSLAFEVNRYLTDYTGFAPYIGLNIAYDHINYSENVNGIKKEQTFKKIEPGITLGWDIIPGKTSEALILRTNFRWYPFSEFEIDKKPFNFSQLEYNLIQIVFYPTRLPKKKR